MRADIDRLVVMLFVIFGFAYLNNILLSEFQVIYDLNDALTALAAYGVLLIVNGQVTSQFQEISRKSKGIHDHRMIFILCFGASIGIVLLSLPLIYIILNSKLFEGISLGFWYVFMALILPILVPQSLFIFEFLPEIFVKEKFKRRIPIVFLVLYLGPTIWLLMNHQPVSSVVTPYLMYIGTLLFSVWILSRKDYSEGRKE